jgi:hypothetical protein
MTLRSVLAFWVVLLSTVALAFACAPGARAETPTWRFAPALAPPPPPDVLPAPYPVPVGRVGQISFWAPNRGLIITGGSGPVPAGLYAYNGLSWHQLASVCGGSEGRIAWAGPDEFWTISDQRGGQELPPQLRVSVQSISLCHFLNGQVVGSYAMPLEQPDSYLRMNAAACYGPTDCWFGGEDGASPNTGAFHLHWNGSSISTVYAPEDHAVTGMINFEDQLFESVQIRESDIFPPSAPAGHPAIIHTIAPTGASPFANLYLFPAPHTLLPEYEPKEPPYDLEGFTLASDGAPLGAGATQLWAAANTDSNLGRGLTVLHCVEAACAGGKWSQVAPEGRAKFGGMTAESTLAPEPGSETAWLPLHSEGYAKVARLNANGSLEEQILPGSQESELGDLGGAGAVTCPAQHDCWMATTAGWLFHLSDGTEYPQDTDPNFAGVITYRPPDEGVPEVYPFGQPSEDTLANQLVSSATSDPPASVTPTAKHLKAKPLVTHVKSRLMHHRVLVISFVLTARAHVQVIGRSNNRVVAKTPAKWLSPGPHTLSLDLDPDHWPKKLSFEARPRETSTPSGGGTSGGGSDTIST